MFTVLLSTEGREQNVDFRQARHENGLIPTEQMWDKKYVCVRHIMVDSAAHAFCFAKSVKMTGASLLAQPANLYVLGVLHSVVNTSFQMLLPFICLANEFSSPAHHIMPFGRVPFASYPGARGTLEPSLADALSFPRRTIRVFWLDAQDLAYCG